MESAVTAPVSGHIKRVVVQEGARLEPNKLQIPDANAHYFRRFNSSGRPDYRNSALDCALALVETAGIGGCTTLNILRFGRQRQVFPMP